MDALHKVLTGKPLYDLEFEDSKWFGSASDGMLYPPIKKQYGIVQFENSGYYLIRQTDNLTFIKNTRYKDRPSHADNLHVDLWYKGSCIS